MTSEKHGMISIVKDPILRLSHDGAIIDCHVPLSADPALLQFEFKNKNLKDFEVFYDLRKSLQECLATGNSLTSYFSLTYKGDVKHYEVLIEPEGSAEALALIKEITKKKQTERELLEYYNILQNIYKGTSAWTGRDFLDHLTLQLADALKSDFAAVCLIDHKRNTLKVVSLSGSAISDSKWNIEDTPFKDVVAEGYLEIDEEGLQQYPKFQFVQNVNLKGFVGVPLFYNELFSKPIGMMMALYREPVKKMLHIEKILHIFSSRAGAELERIENQRTIESSEEKFKALYNNTPALFNSADEQANVIEVGDYFLEITGYNREEVIGRKAYDFLTPESRRTGLRRVFPTYIRKGYCKDVPFQFVKKNGEVLDVLFSAIVVKDNEGNFLKSVMNLNDVTQLRRIEKELRRSEQKIIDAANQYQSLFDNSPVGIIIHTDGIIKHVNAETIRLAKGKSVFDFLNKKALSFVHPDSLGAATSRIEKIYKTKRAHRNEQKFICVDGGIIEVEAMGTLIEYEGKPAVQIAFYDISDRKEAQRELLARDSELSTLNKNLGRQNNQLEEFAHIASHNLRAPITNMMSLIKIMEADSSPENEEFVWDNIRKTIYNLDETIIELNDVVKTSWELDKQKRQLKFQSILDKVMVGINSRVLETNARFEVDFASYSSINYPKVYLESIIQNLITNTLKYKSDERAPIVKINTWTEGKRGYFSIEDNGLGIDLDKYGDKIFGLRKTFHNHVEARGVGLFITKAQVESLGGNIKVESKVGVGTKFIIDFGEI